MELITIVEIIVLLIFTYYLLRKYAAKEVTLGIKILVYFAWFLSFSIVILVPLDVQNVRVVYLLILIFFVQTFQLIDPDNIDSDNLQEFQDFNDRLKILWSIMYWSVQALTWFILPFFQEYENAGQFTKRGRLRQSIYVNGMFYLIMAVIGIIFIVYLIVKNQMGLSSVVAFLMAMSNAFGIFLIIMLLGYGLVKMPRNFWYRSKQELTLKQLNFEASVIRDKKDKCQFELEDLIKVAYIIGESQRYEQDQRLRAKDILRQCTNEMIENAKRDSDILDSNSQRMMKQYLPLNMSKIIKLNTKIKKGIMELKRAECKWEELLEDAFLLQDIIDSQDSINRKIHSAFWLERTGSCGSCVDKTLWFWHVKLKEKVFMALSFLFGIFAVLIVIGEVMQFNNLLADLFYFLLAHHSSFIRTQLFCVIPLLFMSSAVYYSLFKLKISGFLGLYNHQQSDAGSLLFFATLTSRIAAPLCYNFLSMIKIKENQGKPAFFEVMGEVDDALIFGSSFTTFFPILLIVLCLFNLFNIYGKCMSCVGLKKFRFEEDFDDERIGEGMKLLKQARIERERQLKNSSHYSKQNYHGYSAKTSQMFQTELDDSQTSLEQQLR